MNKNMKSMTEGPLRPFCPASPVAGFRSSENEPQGVDFFLQLTASLRRMQEKLGGIWASPSCDPKTEYRQFSVCRMLHKELTRLSVVPK